MVWAELQETCLEDVATERRAVRSANEDLLDYCDVDDGEPAGLEVVGGGFGEEQIHDGILETACHEHLSEGEELDKLHPVSFE